MEAWIDGRLTFTMKKSIEGSSAPMDRTAKASHRPERDNVVADVVADTGRNVSWTTWRLSSGGSRLPQGQGQRLLWRDDQRPRRALCTIRRRSVGTARCNRDGVPAQGA